MEATTKQSTNLILRLLQFKKELRECIRDGADPEKMQQIADDYGFQFAKPI